MHIIARHKDQIALLESRCNFVDAAKLAAEFSEIGDVATAFTASLDSCAALIEPLRSFKLSLTGNMISAFQTACLEKLQILDTKCPCSHGKDELQKWQSTFSFWAEGLAIAKAATARLDSMAPGLAAVVGAANAAAKDALEPPPNEEAARLPATVSGPELLKVLQSK